MNNQQQISTSEIHQPHDALLTSCAIHFPHFFQSYSYSFKTPEEAMVLASSIANLCDVSHKNIELGLNEIFLNAIEHGNLCISGGEKSKLKQNNAWQSEIEIRLQDPYYRYKSVDVLVEITPTLITIKVSDDGDGFDWKQFEKFPLSTLHAYHGRGLLVARSLCFDEMTFSSKGNQVSCAVYRHIE